MMARKYLYFVSRLFVFVCSHLVIVVKFPLKELKQAIQECLGALALNVGPGCCKASVGTRSLHLFHVSVRQQENGLWHPKDRSSFGLERLHCCRTEDVLLSRISGCSNATPQPFGALFFWC